VSEPYADPFGDVYRTDNAQAANARPVDAGPRTPAQRTVASYATYAEAERAVDFLADRRFPVERTAIVGRGLQSVERVTGRLTTWRAAGRAALTGAVVGALFGWLFGLFDLVNPLVAGALLALYGAVFGAVVGGLLGLLGHALTGGRRDFSSVSGLRALTYDILADADVAPAAIEGLQAPGGPGRGLLAGSSR
jgi:hypothetical protein